MPPIPVAEYAIQISTNPPQQPGTPAVPFKTGILIRLQAGGQFQALPINGPDEFMAIVALIQTPGRLMFDPVGMTLEKVGP